MIELFNGEHDFASFAKKEGSEDIPNTSRDMSISMTKLDPYVFSPDLPNPYSLYQIHFKSQAFLYNQVIMRSVIENSTCKRHSVNSQPQLSQGPENGGYNIVICQL